MSTTLWIRRDVIGRTRINPSLGSNIMTFGAVPMVFGHHPIDSVIAAPNTNAISALGANPSYSTAIAQAAGVRIAKQNAFVGFSLVKARTTTGEMMQVAANAAFTGTIIDDPWNHVTREKTMTTGFSVMPTAPGGLTVASVYSPSEVPAITNNVSSIMQLETSAPMVAGSWANVISTYNFPFSSSLTNSIYAIDTVQRQLVSYNMAALYADTDFMAQWSWATNKMQFLSVHSDFFQISFDDGLMNNVPPAAQDAYLLIPLSASAVQISQESGQLIARANNAAGFQTQGTIVVPFAAIRAAAQNGQIVINQAVNPINNPLITRTGIAQQYPVAANWSVTIGKAQIPEISLMSPNVAVTPNVGPI